MEVFSLGQAQNVAAIAIAAANPVTRDANIAVESADGRSLGTR